MHIFSTYLGQPLNSSLSLPSALPFPKVDLAQPLRDLLDFPNSLACCIFYHKFPQMGSSLEILDTHFYKKTQPKVNIFPTTSICPSHTFLAYLLSLDLPFSFPI
jgi:hypothetical protein